MVAKGTRITTSLNGIGLKNSCLGDPDGRTRVVASPNHSGEIEVFTWAELIAPDDP